MSPIRVWFITGASSGFGRCLTEIALNEGDIVIATLRKPQALDDLKAKYPSNKLATLKLDVSKHDEIISAFDKAKELFGRIDVVFNNAGYGLQAEVEGTDEQVSRTNFDTNFWGATNVTREAVKFFREVNPAGQGGRILVTSSECGIHGYPIYGYYCASKHALEGVHDALAKELDPDWNIKITLIEPGYFATKATPNMAVNGSLLPPHPAYTKPTLPGNVLRGYLENPQAEGSDPAKAMQKLYEFSSLSDPPIRFPIGEDAVDALRKKGKEYIDTAERFASWSENLQLD